MLPLFIYIYIEGILHNFCGIMYTLYCTIRQTTKRSRIVLARVDMFFLYLDKEGKRKF